MGVMDASQYAEILGLDGDVINATADFDPELYF